MRLIYTTCIGIRVGIGGPRGPWPPRFYNFSIGIRFLLCKLTLLSLYGAPRPGYLPTLLCIGTYNNNYGSYMYIINMHMYIIIMYIYMLCMYICIRIHRVLNHFIPFLRSYDCNGHSRLDLKIFIITWLCSIQCLLMKFYTAWRNHSVVILLNCLSHQSGLWPQVTKYELIWLYVLYSYIASL